MRRKLPVLLASVVALLIALVPLLAHHGTAAFDTTNMVTVTGKITDFQFVNPHAQVFFECKNDKGEMEQWQGELTAPNKLTRAGWSKRTLKPGDAVTVSGNQVKGGAHTLWIRKLIGPDGTALQLSED
jgi:hypothetical protein